MDFHKLTPLILLSSIMKLLHNDTLFNFTVRQNDAIPPPSRSSDDFHIEFRFRDFRRSNRLAVEESTRTVQISRLLLLSNDDRSSAMSLMARILEEFQVPDRIVLDMAEHFRFFADRLARMNSRPSGAISVAVSLDARVLPPERVATIQRRMEEAERGNRGGSAAREAEVEVEVALPAVVAAVEGLERERIERSGGECGICLEEMVVGEEATRMPCMHLYHRDCIHQWLSRSHFCPFCRFGLPC